MAELSFDVITLPVSVSGAPDHVGAGLVTVTSGANLVTISGAQPVILGAGGIAVVSGTDSTTIDGTGVSGGGGVANALIGADGITVTSGTSTDTISGFYTEFTSASGTLSSEIDNDISIHTADASAHHTRYSKNENDAITGSDGITVTSGSNIITLTGFYTEFTNASGTLSSEIDADIAAVSGTLSSEIDSDVSSLSGTLSAEIDSDIVAVSGTLSGEIDSDVAAVSGTLSAEIDSDIATHAALPEPHHLESRIRDADGDTYIDTDVGDADNDNIPIVCAGSEKARIWTGGIGRDNANTVFQTENPESGGTYFRFLGNTVSNLTGGTNQGEVVSIYNAGAGAALSLKGEATNDTILYIEAPSMTSGSILVMCAPDPKTNFTGEYFEFCGKSAKSDHRFNKWRYMIGARNETIIKSMAGLGGGKHLDTWTQLTGTVTAPGTTTLTGTGTKFLSELRVGDWIRLETGTVSRVVWAIASDTELTMSSAATKTDVACYRTNRQYAPFTLYFENNTGSHGGGDSVAAALKKAGNCFGIWFNDQERMKYVKALHFVDGEEPSSIRNSLPDDDDDGYAFVTEEKKANQTVVVSGTSETEVLTHSIPGGGGIVLGTHVYDVGHLGTKNEWVCTIAGTITSNNSDSLIIRTKYGSTVLTSGTVSLTDSATDYAFEWTLRLVASGTQHQKCFTKFEAYEKGGENHHHYMDYGTADENSKSTLSIQATIEWTGTNDYSVVKKEMLSAYII